MAAVLKILSSIEQKTVQDDGSLKIVGYASTSDVDRAGDIIIPSAWTTGLDNFKRNPIILFSL